MNHTFTGTLYKNTKSITNPQNAPENNFPTIFKTLVHSSKGKQKAEIKTGDMESMNRTSKVTADGRENIPYSK